MQSNAKILPLTAAENSLSKEEAQIVALFSKAIITHCKSKAYDTLQTESRMPGRHQTITDNDNSRTLSRRKGNLYAVK